MSVLDVRIDDGVAVLTVNRPDALNALNSDVLQAFIDTLPTIEARAIIVTGAGPKAFVAGADIAEMKDYGPDEAETFSRRGGEAFRALQGFPGPVIAAVNGFALGGGLELALACDILVAADTAKMGLPEATLAVVPGFGGSQTLPRRVGPGHAKRLLFTGAMVDAEEALRIGLADLVVAGDALMETCMDMARKALRNGPVAVKEAKRLVNDGAHLDLMEALSLESLAFGRVFGTKDQKEGMGAFLEKRKPSYQGE